MAPGQGRELVALDRKELAKTPALPHGVRAVVRLRVEPGKKRFGIVALNEVIPTWKWFIGRQGVCSWIVSEKGLPRSGSEADTNTSAHHKTSKVNWLLLSTVDVVLVQGMAGPPLSHEVWKLPEVNLIVWSNHRTRGGRHSVPQGWQLELRRLDHARLGGVTDGKFMFAYAKREANRVLIGRLEAMFPNCLGQVWNPTHGGRPVDIEESSKSSPERVTTSGLLPWKSRFDVFVCGPSVFSKEKWVSRKLTPRELADAVDVPAVEFKKASVEWQSALVNMETPGKVLVSALQLIKWEQGDTELSTGSPAMKDDYHNPKKVEGSPSPTFKSTSSRTDNDHVDVSSNPRPLKRVRWSQATTEPERVTKLEADRGLRGLMRTPRRTEDVGKVYEVVRESEGKEGPSKTMKESTVSDKAVKSDKAGVPRQLWDSRAVKGTAAETFYVSEDSALQERVEHALDVLRRLALGWWKRRTCRSFLRWFKSLETAADTREEVWASGLDALRYVVNSGWWEWTGGSGILFWRWPSVYQDEMRIGVPPYFVEAPPHAMDRQPPYTSEEVKLQVAEKINAVIDKGYVKHLEKGQEVVSLMYMFHVPKGTEDIRMVYDGSKSGLNKTLFAPWFHIHTVDMMCRSLLPAYWCADNDYGEQFLNFNLHPELQRYCGVDLTQLADDKSKSKSDVFGQWKRCAMGLRPSPYAAVKGALIARRMILGDRHDPKNPFRWQRVVLNQPGDKGYRAELPWIMQVKEDGHLATAVCQYIDDLRTCASSEAEAWSASCRIGKVLTHLGLQDAARKRREPSQSPGAWSGATVTMTGSQVYQSVTRERWVKTRTLIRWIAGSVGLFDEGSHLLLSEEDKIAKKGTSSSSMINHKRMESARGFLVYVANTFKAMVPYLKGIHLTLDSWRDHRDSDGWKLPYRLRELSELQEDSFGKKPPTSVRGVPRLMDDLVVLMKFTASVDPPRVPARPSHSLAMFIVGDASGTGFGGSTWKAGEAGITASFGAWDKRLMRESSNFKEAYNLVLLLEHQLSQGEIERGSEIFVFTDNSTAERAFNKGASTSKTLHDLIVRIRGLEMEGLIFPRFVWIAGERMIAQGTDGLSRGDQTCGVMNDGKFLSHVPLNKTVFEYTGDLSKELPSWLSGGKSWKMLKEEDWFDEVFKQPTGCFVWTPSAALARVAVEQLCEVKHVHPYSCHLFLTPALMTGNWRRLLGKQSDLILTLPAGPTCWPSSCFEPLVMSLTCALLPSSPWVVRDTDWVCNWSETMREVWETTSVARGDHLRKFWKLAESGTTTL